MIYLIMSLAGITLILIGYSRSGHYPACAKCKDPMPLGFGNVIEGKPICRKCCKKLNVPMWYHK